VQTHLIPGAGHSPNVEKPEVVAPLILGFASPQPNCKNFQHGQVLGVTCNAERVKK
jgi:hypothetical protein